MEFENLLTLIQAVSDSELTGFKYEENGVKVCLSKEKKQIFTAVQGEGPVSGFAAGTVLANEAVPAKEAMEKETAEPLEHKGNIVKSPLVGTFYAAPAEDADAFVKVGDAVKKGQVLAIVEAMKLMNEIESDFDGTVEEVLVENGQAVEYGQPLFRIV